VQARSREAAEGLWVGLGYLVTLGSGRCNPPNPPGDRRSRPHPGPFSPLAPPAPPAPPARTPALPRAAGLLIPRPGKGGRIPSWRPGRWRRRRSGRGARPPAALVARRLHHADPPVPPHLVGAAPGAVPRPASLAVTAAETWGRADGADGSVTEVSARGAASARGTRGAPAGPAPSRGLRPPGLAVLGARREPGPVDAARGWEAGCGGRRTPPPLWAAVPAGGRHSWLKVSSSRKLLCRPRWWPGGMGGGTPAWRLPSGPLGHGAARQGSARPASWGRSGVDEPRDRAPCFPRRTNERTERPGAMTPSPAPASPLLRHTDRDGPHFSFILSAFDGMKENI
jgi:hypothetical protein